MSSCLLYTSGQEICKKQLFALATKIEYADSNEHGTQYDELLNAIVQKLAWLPPEEIIRRVLTLEADRIMRYYANTPDPVSYTHLDVYKRQIIRCWRRAASTSSS